MLARVLSCITLCSLGIGCNKNQIGSISASAAEPKEVKTVLYSEELDPKIQESRFLDILLVIDNSGSMSDKQQNLSTKIEPLLEHVKDSDWQVAITTTDTKDCIRKIIKKENQDEFEPTVRGLGIGVADNPESAILQAIRALKGACAPEEWPQNIKHGKSGCGGYEHWLRNNSTVAILLVTDEDHQCHHRDLGCKITDFYFYLNSIRTLHATAKVYGLLEPAESNKFKNWVDGGGESIFDHVASIRDRDYTDTLVEISESIASAMKTSFILEHPYDGMQDTTVTAIKQNGERVVFPEESYIIDGSTLEITGSLPEDTDIIEVSYSYNPDSSEAATEQPSSS